jgi:AcrR family transcriptional regulator
MNKKPERKNEIYEAALKVFGVFGYKKATVEEIAAELKLTKGALYQYAENKKDLYRKAVEYGLIKWQNKVLCEISDTDDICLRFRQLCKKAMMYLSEDKDLRNIIIRDPGIFPISFKNDPYKQINDVSMTFLRDLIDEGIAEGKFRELDSGFTTKMLFSIYKMLILETYILGEQETERVFDAAIDIISQGFFKR